MARLWLLQAAIVAAAAFASYWYGPAWPAVVLAALAAVEALAVRWQASALIESLSARVSALEAAAHQGGQP